MNHAINHSLRVSIGQHTDAGPKAENQDCFGFRIPGEPQLALKGACFAIADGISSSSVSRIASETSIKSFLDDYYCTSDAWSPRHAAEQVLKATNAWLHAQTRQSPYRYEKDKGYVCTFSAAIFRGSEAHLLHLGDTRIYRLRNSALEQLTHDHRIFTGEHQGSLSRALGAEVELEVDYRRLKLEAGDLFLLTTDGAHEHLPQNQLIELICRNQNNLDRAARALVCTALANGSDDNLSVQLVRIDQLATETPRLHQQAETLPLPPLLKTRDQFDGFTIERQLHASSRSHVYLASDSHNHGQVVLKTPSIDLSQDPAYLERLLQEEWIARRVNSTHVIRAIESARPRNYLYTASEYIEGKTLKQWLLDNPRPSLEKVRTIIEQVARGLQALHRAEILHQDLRPENILIDSAGTAIIIDLGSARVDGITETEENTAALPPGTAIYSAPEYFLGDLGTSQSDLFSLAVLTYHMLSGEFPYGIRVASCNTPAAQLRLRYRSVLSQDRAIPAWIDATLKKALQPSPHKRYEEISEFVYDLRHPNPEYLNATRPPLIERYPVHFWQTVSAGLLLTVFYLLARLAGTG